MISFNLQLKLVRGFVYHQRPSGEGVVTGVFPSRRVDLGQVFRRGLLGLKIVQANVNNFLSEQLVTALSFFSHAARP